jgi:hypothetical protein
LIFAIAASASVGIRSRIDRTCSTSACRPSSAWAFRRASVCCPAALILSEVPPLTSVR